MERKNKACWNCKNFGRYYKKGVYRFYKTDEGTCSIKREVVQKNGLCERWRNTCALRSRRKKDTLRILNEIFSDLSAIKQILEEEQEDEKTHPHHVLL